MDERFIEIRFCLFIDKLFKTFKYSIYTLDVIEAYCNLGNIESLIIKKLVKQIKDKSGGISTYRDEVVYVYSSLGYSYREVYRLTGISIGSQQRIHKDIKEHPDKYKNITTKLTIQEYEEVYKFVKVMDLMKGI